ncbi:VWA domain-containing protein [Bifidobacterium pullorum subsp. saeculare]|uniref:vWA domain-containing protein n=1 Tax=Bifidobacterium pullorum TaxID=78448 RepID=UPI00195C24A3|nr:vWA domain-containing protein [Bifidobacterium pullorum]MBM6730580.1 VWA domain-containing protein [Bifidobacterium pullorum subsp. saeculare]
MRVRKTQEKVYNEASGRTTMMIGKAIRRALKVGTVLLASTAMLIPGTALAADGETADSTTVVDGNTSGQYAESLGDNDSTRYAGRVWNDKTVSANNMEFNMTSGVNGTVLKDGSDFLVTYSMLATSQQITQLPRVPVDVVFILDFSASMTWGVDSTSVSKEDGSDSRIKYMVDALNNTIDALKEDSDPSHPNRIGIAYFNRTGHELLPLTELSENNLKKVKDGKYLSLAFKGTNGEDDGEATVTCNIGVHTTSAKTDSKTNIQFGLHEGMSMLADEQTTTFEYDDKTYTRIPNIVLMSDGAPTTISLPTNVQGDGTDDKPQSGSWWGKLDRNEGKDGTEDSAGWGDNSNAWSANGMMPMLTAQYLKGEIDAHYASTPNLANADQARSSMYTIGFGINKQTPSMVELANMVLNPNGNWGNQTDNACKEIVDAWEQYVDGGRPVLEYPKPKTKEGKVEKGYYQATHPSSYDPNTEVPNYVDAYYPADDANALENAFKEITNAITETAKAPTKTTSDPVRSGYVTYTDVIGEYMHVDSVKTLIYADQRFDLQPEQSGSVSVSEDKKTTTYVFNGPVDSPVYGSHNVNEIAITVTQTKTVSKH